MYQDHTIAVVVPAYNEADHVGAVLDDIPAFVDVVYAIDDRSTDGTWDEIRSRIVDDPVAHPVPGGGSGDGADGTSALDGASSGSLELSVGGVRSTATAGAREHADRAPPAEGVLAPPASAPVSVADGGETGAGRLVAVRHHENQGAGGALRTGYLLARADGMDVTVAMDADGQMDPDQMPDLLDPVVAGEADYAKGNRLADPEYRDAMPRFRLFGNWMLTMLTKVASGYWKTMDPQNGYTAVSHEALEAIDLSSMPSGHDYTNDLLVRLNVNGMRIADVDMPAVYGEEGSTIDYGEFVPRTSTTLFRSFCWRIERTYLTRDFHPLAFLYGAGALSATTGLLWGVDGLRSDDGSDDSRLLGGLVSLLVGSLFVALAMVFDAEHNDDREVQRE